MDCALNLKVTRNHHAHNIDTALDALARALPGLPFNTTAYPKSRSVEL